MIFVGDPFQPTMFTFSSENCKFGVEWGREDSGMIEYWDPESMRNEIWELEIFDLAGTENTHATVSARFIRFLYFFAS